jgi:SAM-dependent methyltransferase
MESPPSPGKSQTEEERAFYDEMWRNYAHLDAVSPAAIHRRRQVMRVAARYAGSPRVILDVGCGQGELLRQLAEQYPGARIMGADISEQSIIDSRRRNPGFTLFTIDLVSKEFEKAHAAILGTCDLVVCSEVVEHIAEAALAVQRLRLLLAPGGVAIVTVPGGRMSRFDVAIGHQRHYSTRALDGLLRDAGLDVLSVRAWGFPFHSVYREAVRIVSRVTVPSKAPKNTSLRGKTEAKNGGFSSLLSTAYTLFGKSLTPLFYLNISRWGEQMLAAAKRREGS